MTALAEQLTFAAPSALALLALIPVLLLLARRVGLTALPPLQLGASLLLRALLLACLVLALARPIWLDASSRVCAVVALDVSDSVDDRQLAAAGRALDDARAAARPGDRLLAVTFGAKARLLAPGALVARHDGAASSPSAAVRLAEALCGRDHVRRVAVVSDGVETEDDLEAAAAAFAAGGGRLYALPLPPRDDDEALVASASVTDPPRAGATFPVKVELAATRAQEAIVRLSIDGRPAPLSPSKPVRLEAGTTSLALETRLDEPGVHTLRVELAAPHPGRPENDVAELSLETLGRPRVLYVEKGGTTAGALPRALAAEHIDVDVRGPASLPRDPAALERYDLVVLADVSASFLGATETRALEAFVRGGGGLLVAGGESSFEPGGYAGTAFERLLPVRSDPEKEREEPQLALALVIDRSGSMSGEKMEMAKAAAAAAAELLAASDLVAVVAFDSAANVVTRLQRAANRVRIGGDIARITAGGGTRIFPAVQEAFQQLAPARAKIKHVILLTDGQSPYEGIGELVDDMVAQGITLSSVGVGREADRTLLAMVAQRGGGRYYYAESAGSVPRIFTRETQEVARSALREEPARIVVVKRADAFAGVELGAAPPLKGHVLVRMKPAAELLLATSTGDPLLARWRVGLGDVVAWTSDLGRRWSAALARWPEFPKLGAQLVRTTMRRRAADRFPVRVEVDRGRARVMVDAVGPDDRFLDGLEARLEVVGRDRKPAETLPMRQSAPGRYEAELPAATPGPRLLRASFRQGERAVGEASASLLVPYPAEYLRRPVDRDALARAAAAGGGALLADARTLFDPGADRVLGRRELWEVLLLAALPLLVLDLLTRRVRLPARRRRRS